jgi:hypothetical protein
LLALVPLFKIEQDVPEASLKALSSCGTETAPKLFMVNCQYMCGLLSREVTITLGLPHALLNV